MFGRKRRAREAAERAARIEAEYHDWFQQTVTEHVRSGYEQPIDWDAMIEQLGEQYSARRGLTYNAFTFKSRRF